MKTIEHAAELHQAIQANAPHPGGLSQTLAIARGWASNQEQHSMTFTSRVAPADVVGDARGAFLQGFGCVEVNITAKWGGCHHDGAPRTETEISIHVLDRLAGGMALRTWHTRGVWQATSLADEDVLPLIRRLLGQEPIEAIIARGEAEEQACAAAGQEWLDKLGL